MIAILYSSVSAGAVERATLQSYDCLFSPPCLQNNADPSLLLAKSVLSDVLFPSGPSHEKGGEFKQLALEAEHIVIEFRCW